jgi:hypothetical protein
MATSSPAGNLRAWSLRALLAALVVVLCATATPADSPSNVVRVEQDWELVVGMPDPVQAAPQVVCVIAPFGHVRSLHAAFELNQRSHAHSFTAGGMQLQVWDGERTLNDQTSESTALLNYEGETITWTQKMLLVDGKLVFAVTNGQSSTWGRFGFWDEHLLVTADSDLTNLNGYSTAISVANSGAGYGANRVRKLAIKQVRSFTADGQQTTDNDEKVICQHD